MVFWRWKTSRSKEEDPKTPPVTGEDGQAQATAKEDEEAEGERKEKVSPESLQKQHLLEAQRRREEDATLRGVFCGNQRVRYFYKAVNEWYDAAIVAVHYDDGPDKPYYTVVYSRTDVETEEDGNESVRKRKVEKQTTPDRLQLVEFDVDKTWEILSNAKKWRE